MEFSKNDIRAAADEGAFLHLCDDQAPHELLYDENGQKVGFYVRGNATREAEQQLTKARAAGKDKIESANDLHQGEVRIAMALIISAENMEWMGETVGGNKDLIRKVLDSTFPELRSRDDDEKKSAADAEGLDYLNKPLANQVVRFAARQGNFRKE